MLSKGSAGRNGSQRSAPHSEPRSYGSRSNGSQGSRTAASNGVRGSPANGTAVSSRHSSHRSGSGSQGQKSGGSVGSRSHHTGSQHQSNGSRRSRSQAQNSAANLSPLSNSQGSKRSAGRSANGNPTFQSQQSAFKSPSRSGASQSRQSGGASRAVSAKLEPLAAPSHRSSQNVSRALTSQAPESAAGSRALIPSNATGSRAIASPPDDGVRDYNELRQWLEDRDLRLPEQQLEALYQKLLAEGVTKTLELLEFDEEEVRAICAELGLNRLTTKRFARAVKNLDPATIALPMPAATQPEQTSIRQLAERARQLDDLRQNIETRAGGVEANVAGCKQEINRRFDMLIKQLAKRKERELAKLQTETRHYSEGLQEQLVSVSKAINSCQTAKDICAKALRIADIQNLGRRKNLILSGVEAALRVDYDKSDYGPGNFKVEFDEKMFRVANKPDMCRVTVNRMVFTPEKGLGPQAGPGTALWDPNNGSDELVINRNGNEVGTTTKTFGGFHSIRAKTFLEKGVHRYEIRPWWESSANEGEMIIGVVTQGYKEHKTRDPTGAFLGRDAHSWGWYLWAPWKSHAAPQWDTDRPRYGKPVKNNDVIIMIIDMNKRTVEFELNGRKQGVAFTDIAPIVAPAVSLKGQLSVQSPQRSRCLIRRLRL